MFNNKKKNCTIAINDSLDVDVLANQVEEYVLKYDVAKFEKIEKEKRNFFM